MNATTHISKTTLREINFKHSRRLHARAQAAMPDGVAAYSQSRAPHPIYLAGAHEARLVDIDGNEYIDYMLGAGPLVLGHRHPKIIEAIQTALHEGIPNIGVCERQIELAELLQRYLPSMEQIRFLPTGTEAVQAAIRVARRFTGRQLIAKFEGAYHGQAENVLISVDGSAETRGPASAPNAVPYHCPVPAEVLKLTVVLPFNDIDACTALIEQHAKDLALVLVEPMLGFSGAIPAEPEFLRALREVTARHGVLLAFDEVITGFRLAMGGGQEFYRVTPDLTVLGKAIGGGMPLAAFGGRKDVMDYLSVTEHPEDYVFQSGTFSAFPISVAAGLATLRTMAATNAIAGTNAIGEQMRAGLRKVISDCGFAASVTGVGSLFHIHFTNRKVRSAREAGKANQALIQELHQRLLAYGIYFYRGRLGFLSTAHASDDIGMTLDSVQTVLQQLKEEGYASAQS